MASKLDLKKLRERHHQFFLVIYPETDADVNAYHCGSGLDLGLSSNGIEEGRKLARRFKKNPLKIKNIFASPELRAIQMADVLHDEMRGKIILCREFCDQALGLHEGRPLQKDEDPFFIFPAPERGETEDLFSLRVREGLEKIFKAELLSALVTHPRVAAQVLAWLGLENESLERGKMYAIDLPADQGKAHYREI